MPEKSIGEDQVVLFDEGQKNDGTGNHGQRVAFKFSQAEERFQIKL